jgi:hypothetical protein
MDWLKSIFGAGASTLVKEVFEGIASIDNKDLRIKAAARMNELLLMVEMKHLEISGKMLQLEGSGNWLQRSWRPILALNFGFVITYSKFIAPAFGLPNAELEDAFWALLNIMVGGYALTRSGEKIAKTVSAAFVKKEEVKSSN